MTHGAPDYSNVRKAEYSFRLDDMGELAARLGSPQIYDRRGEILYIETFKHGFRPWQNWATGANAVVELDEIRTHTDGFSLLMRGGSDGDRDAIIRRILPLVNMSSIGIEIRAMVNDDINYLRTSLYIYDGSSLYFVYAIYYAQTDILKILDSDGSEVTISTGFNLSTAYETFNFMKFTVDWINKTYKRGLFNGNEIDISAYSIQQTASALSPHIIIDIRLQSTDGNNGEVFLDNIIITRNED